MIKCVHFQGEYEELCGQDQVWKSNLGELFSGQVNEKYWTSSTRFILEVKVWYGDSCRGAIGDISKLRDKAPHS